MKYNLSICAIVRDELDLKEWLHFHRLVGVQHFYIYDNQSDPQVKDILKKEVSEGLVDVIYWPGNGDVQMPAYSHCLNTFKEQSDWIIVLDADEYIYGRTDDNIVNIFKDYERPGIGGLVVNWVLVGSNGKTDRPEGLVIENYTKMMPKDHPENRHIKTAFRKYASRPGPDPHHFLYQSGYDAVNENYEIVIGPFSKHSSSRIIINHYVLKSLSDYKKNKLSRPRADTSKHPGKSIEDFYRFDKDCIEENLDILRFSSALKLEMEKYK